MAQIHSCTAYKFCLQEIILLFNRSPTCIFFHWMSGEQEIILVKPKNVVLITKWQPAFMFTWLIKPEFRFSFTWIHVGRCSQLYEKLLTFHFIL